jgi:hypothetical protein
VLALEDAALATSGDYRNRVTWRGRGHSHVIDPRSGRPVQHPLVSVSVLAREAARADAWATALLVLGPDRRTVRHRPRGAARGTRHPGARASPGVLTQETGPMQLFVFTFAGLCLAFLAMALGVLLGRSPLVRGCGGAESEACRVCTRPCPRRRAGRHEEARR